MSRIVEALDWAVGATKPVEMRTEDGRPYLVYGGGRIEWLMPPLEPTIHVRTLESLARLVGPEDWVLVAPSEVTVMRKQCIAPWLTRAVVAVAKAYGEMNRGASWANACPASELIAQVQVQAADAGDRARLLETLGNLRHEDALQVNDDGVTQVATFKQGITRAALRGIQNPFALHPYRTFAEVAAPAAHFILRLLPKGKDDAQIMARLTEVTDGLYASRVCAAIVAYLGGCGVPAAQILC